MQPVGVAIPDVVDQVDDTGQRAEHDEREDRLGDGAVRGLPVPEHQPREDKEILRPLTGSKRPQQIRRKRAGADVRGSRGSNCLAGGRRGYASHEGRVTARFSPGVPYV